MKVLHLNASLNGGAAKAAMRIHESLLKIGVDSTFLTKESVSIKNSPSDYSLENYFYNKPELTLKNYISEKFFKKFTKQRLSVEEKKSFVNNKLNPKVIGDFEIFTNPFSVVDITKLKEYIDSDVIHFHWISGFVDFESFFKVNKKPIIWTLHDENPFRGGFHYENDELRNQNELNIEYLKIKKSAYENLNKFNIVTPSNWLKNKAVTSGVFGNVSFYQQNNPIDTAIYRPISRDYSKSVFNISPDKKVFVFVSENVSSYRKGYDILSKLIFDNVFKDVFFLIVGNCPDNTISLSNTLYLGRIEDERFMNIVYNAGDFFILPSREDNQPNTMCEALCSGTPVISFNISDNKSILVENNIGVVCDDISEISLKKTMIKCLNGDYLFNKEKISSIASMIFSQLSCGNFYKMMYYNLKEK